MEIRAVGSRKQTAAPMKKKSKLLPNNAVAGKFRMLSMETVISMARGKRVSFLMLMVRSFGWSM